jgi:hypothetical protein
MSILPGLQFGSGYLLAAPQTASGNPAPNPTPVQPNVIQNIKFTLGADIKSLFGQNQWPVDSAIGKRSIKGSFEFAQITNFLMSQVFFGDGTTEGVLQTVTGEQHTIPATPYQITVTNFVDPIVDQGVVYTATGLPLTQHATPTTGQYSVDLATGVYTFAAADTGMGVSIAYQYSIPSTGTTLTVENHQMGWGPVVALDIWDAYEQGNFGLQGIGFYFPNVRLGKIDATSKIDDYQMYTTDFEAFAGPNGIPFVSYNIA